MNPRKDIFRLIFSANRLPRFKDLIRFSAMIRKTLILLISLWSISSAVAVEKEAPDANKTFERGKTAYEKGDYKKARALFLATIRQNPRHPQAKNYLRYVKAASKYGVRPTNPKAKLEKIMIDKAVFENMTVKDALAVVREKVSQATKGQFKPNFLLKSKSTARINLDLGDLPATELIRYVADLSGHDVRYDPHAVVLVKKAAKPNQAAASK